jgi:hypothetical protein
MTLMHGPAEHLCKTAHARWTKTLYDHFLMAQGWFFCPLLILYALATGTLIRGSDRIGQEALASRIAMIFLAMSSM